VKISVETPSPREFAIKLRLPEWCKESSLKPLGAKPGADGYAALRRAWKTGDTIELNLTLAPRLVIGDHLNQGKAALLFGPLVLAADESLLPENSPSLSAVSFPKPELAALSFTPEPAPVGWKTWPGAQCFKINATGRSGRSPFSARLVPFADAGSTGMKYRIWLPIAGQPNANLLLDGTESRSRQGNLDGSINDDNLQSLVVTFDGNRPAEDWFAVAVPQPVTASRVVFTHGKNFHDGGWFDTSAGKPRVQVRRTADAGWETVGELSDYPATTAASAQHDRLTWGNRQFTLKLARPVTFVSVRVIGVPGSGDAPQQAFASCAELQAFSD
jgi:hypothetical protein